MTIRNSEVAQMFSTIADLLDIKGENRFRVRAYRRAAQVVKGLGEDVSEMVKEGKDFTLYEGIGKDLSQKIKTIVKTGSLPILKNLRKEIPEELSHIMKVAQLGARRVKTLHEKLGISTAKELKKAAEQKEVRTLDGFGEKTEKKILRELKRITESNKRVRIDEAEEMAEPLKAYLEQSKTVKKITIAGSYRRCKETVGDLDVLVTCSKGKKVIERFLQYEDVEEVVAKGNKKASVLLRNGLQVDLRLIQKVSFGAALMYFTGSKEHNIAIRKIAQKKKYKISEYGIFKGKKRIAGKTEKEVYRKIGLAFIPPEMRELRGEIDLAKRKKIPNLITQSDIRGDLHVHTSWTDGKNTLEEMAEAAVDIGYEYIAITEHTQHVRVAGGLSNKKMLARLKKIDAFNKKHKKITILKSAEVDILEDGSLDLSEEVLKKLDFTVCSIHSKFNLSRKRQTERMLKAIRNPYCTIIGHPTGRMIGSRAAYDIDMEKIMHEAKKSGCVLELNANPERLDLKDHHLKLARDIGVLVVISTDAHSCDSLTQHMHYGINQARRGWLEAKHVLNTKPKTTLLKKLKKKK